MTSVEMHEHSVKKVFNQTVDDQLPVWNKETFKKLVQVKIIALDNMTMEFDVIGIHCSFVNAIRRVLLAEVPTMAVEKVHIYNNTSIIQDEVLAHRLGLVPLKADPRKFSYRKIDEDEPFSAEDTLEFELKVKCTRGAKVSLSRSNVSQDSFKDCKNIDVFSRQFEWIPIGDQSSRFEAHDVSPIHDNILLAKLRPGHEIDLKLYAFKGIGRDHAKFQPVATASYRLLPQITLLRDVEGEQAQRLKSSFSPGVIELLETKGKVKAYVEDARYDSCSRNVYRHEDLKNCVSLSRVPDHYIFTIESVGALPPTALFIEAVKVLKDKCDRILNEIKINGKTSFI